MECWKLSSGDIFVLLGDIGYDIAAKLEKKLEKLELDCVQ
jgi:hypothetical protein